MCIRVHQLVYTYDVPPTYIYMYHRYYVLYVCIFMASLVPLGRLGVVEQ